MLNYTYIHASVVDETFFEDYTTIFCVMASLTRWSTNPIMINNKCEKICIILKMIYNLEQLFHIKFHWMIVFIRFWIQHLHSFMNNISYTQTWRQLWMFLIPFYVSFVIICYWGFVISNFQLTISWIACWSNYIWLYTFHIFEWSW